MRKMTDEEVMAELNTDTPLNRARRVFAGETGRLEQKAMQRYEPTAIEWKRMEFDAVKRIAAELGVEI